MSQMSEKLTNESEYNFSGPSPTFDKYMKLNIKQSNMRKVASDAGPNRAGLFTRASQVAFLAKVGLGGDFYNRLAH